MKKVVVMLVATGMLLAACSQSPKLEDIAGEWVVDYARTVTEGKVLNNHDPEPFKDFESLRDFYQSKEKRKEALRHDTFSIYSEQRKIIIDNPFLDTIWKCSIVNQEGNIFYITGDGFDGHIIATPDGFLAIKLDKVPAATIFLKRK